MAPRGMTPDRAERANKVMIKRRDGKSFREIAADLNISVSVAHQDYKRAIRDVYLHSTEELVSTQHQRLEALHKAYIEQATNGDIDSANVCLKVNEQVAKLFGLNSAMKLDVQGGAADKFVEFLNTLRDTGSKGGEE